MKTYTAKKSATRAAKKALVELGCSDPMVGEDFTIEETEAGFAFKISSTWWKVEDEATEEPVLAETPNFAKPVEVPDVDMDELVAAEAPGAKPEAEKAPKKLSLRAQKQAEIEAAIANGELPPKPVMASSDQAANIKRVDLLAELAESGDVEGIAAIEITGKAHSAEKARRYQANLLAAFEVQAAKMKASA